ncbi:MAG: triose-phosphate isomerase [Candidatus Thermoplasmatota archaeon]|nr:triose-phosphate isomerase [Candidatus Thermoplasmatota archaeon]
MELPVIILNFKTYPCVDGEGALELARACEEVARETGKSIVVCPPMVELSRVAAGVSIPVFAQNVDVWDGSVTTGSTTLSAVKAAGASGILINHSESRRKLSDIEALIRKAREMGLTTIVCSNNVETSRAAAVMGPDLVAMEPPELIGGDISVTTADPGIVKDTVEALSRIAPDVKVLTGAGVKTREDVSMALKLGTCGVLLASGVVKARDPKGVLLSLAQGL